MLGQSSFRRILLLRILLLSIPILFLGTGVTFRKARTSLLTTAHKNLTQSSAQKAAFVEQSVKSLATHLALASETAALQSGSSGTTRAFLFQLLQTLQTDDIQDTGIRCLQLQDSQSKLVASTCGDQPIAKAAPLKSWNPTENLSDNKRLKTYIVNTNSTKQTTRTDKAGHLHLVVSVPVYSSEGEILYSLSADTLLSQPETDEPWLLQGYSIVIDPNGTILTHPDGNRVGKNIAKEEGGDRFQDILNNVKRNEQGVRHIMGIMGEKEVEWIAGFTPLNITGLDKDDQPLAVLAVTRQDNALQGLEEITTILLILTAGLLAAHLLAMVYMARDIALPIEQLGKYALRIHKRNALERAPKNFRIRELNHLSEVLDSMVGRLEERARELESAWQEAENANQLKSQFLANTSHELRTPLNAIIGCIRLVKDDCCDSREEEVEFLEQADKAAIHLLKIINDLLDIQRIEEEKLPLAIETVDLQHIIDDVVALETVQIQQKGLRLTLEGVADPIWLKADPARLKQILLNVVYNAIKFTDRGTITIRTHLELREERVRDLDYDEERKVHKTWVLIAVQDTGIGIEPTEQSKLFRPFVMVDGTTTRKFEGTGLGLAISRKLVELMGGRIRLHSEGIDMGTTVEIALPVLDAIAPESVTPIALPETVTPSAMSN
jgi:signal transduction histidine kinase